MGCEEVADAGAVGEEPVVRPSDLGFWSRVASRSTPLSPSSRGPLVDRGLQTVGEITVAIHTHLEPGMLVSDVKEMAA
jgi:hypothetical protein